MNKTPPTVRATRPLAKVWMFMMGALLTGCDAVGTPGLAQPPQATESLESPSVVTWKLPKPLREISGLASDAEGLIYAVADERANVFVLNPVTGETVSVFGLGDPAVLGDFEGIALHNNWLYLIASDGRVLRTPIAQNSDGTLNERLDGSTLSFDTFWLNSGCKEIEGLAADPTAARLWIVCKKIAASAARDDAKRRDGATVIRLEAWSVDRQGLIPDATMELPLAGVLALTGQKKFKPSGIAFVPAADERAETQSEYTNDAVDLLIISGAQRAYSRWRWPAEPQFNEQKVDGPVLRELPALVRAGRLSADHRQAEGVAAGANRTLLIADEGAGKRGRLRVYPEGVLQ